MLAWFAIIARENLPMLDTERGRLLNLREADEWARSSGLVGDVRWSSDPAVREAQSAQWGTTPTMAPSAPRETMRRILEVTIESLGRRVAMLLEDGTINMSWPDVEAVRRSWSILISQSRALPPVIQRPLYERWQLALGAWDHYLDARGYSEAPLGMPSTYEGGP